MSVPIPSIQRARHCRALSKDGAENAGGPGVESGPPYPALLLPTSAGMILSGDGPRGYFVSCHGKSGRWPSMKHGFPTAACVLQKRCTHAAVENPASQFNT